MVIEIPRLVRDILDFIADIVARAAADGLYEVDFGDSWLHLCTVAARRIDPTEQLGIIPSPRCPTGAGE